MNSPHMNISLLARVSWGAAAARHLSAPCVTTLTPTEQLYAGKLAGGRIGVLTGGNGSAAKSADEIGCMGALMMLHETWTYDIPAEQFQLRFATQ